MPRIHSRSLALLTAVALVSPAVAHAGPDDGRTVATAAHVDSPKTFWENDTFVLKSEFSGTTSPLDGTVAWVGKGYGSDGRNQYQFTLLDNGLFDFFGSPGETYYTAPAVTWGSHQPIWMGFGADAGLPTEAFRDHTASLDLLSVNGPGNVELFTYFDSESGLRRMLGTSKDSPKSFPLSAGNHTHNYTAFSKPGRYELTYRTTARGKDGKLIASQPTVAVVQVGGQSPKAEKTQSTRERFDAAKAGTPTELADASYSLHIAPKAERSQEGDEHLSTIRFEAGNKANGTLTLFIDGYFLTDLDVKDGTAQWDEFLGPKDSQIQAVFTPDDGPRWVSTPLQYTHGTESTVTSKDSAETWTDHTGDASTVRQLQDTEEPTVTNSKFTAHIEPYGESSSKLVVETEDKNFNGFISGGFYDGGDATFAGLDFEGYIHNGHGEILIGDENLYNGQEARVVVIPHPTVKAQSGTVVLAKSYQRGETFDAKGTLGSAPESESTASSAAPTPKTKPHQQPSEPAVPEKKCSSKHFLDHGHVDIKAMREGDKLTTVLKDETSIVDKGVVDRPLDDVVLAVHDNALVKRNKRMGDKKLDFMGKVGEKFYMLPETQNHDIIWPGYNTQSLDYGQTNGTVNLNFEPKSVPEGATWELFISRNLGQEQEVLMDSTKGDHTIETTFAAHTHTSWAFSHPGVYTFDVTYDTTTKDGKKITPAPQTLTLAVGDQAIKDCKADLDNSHPSDEVKPTTAKPAPKLAPKENGPSNSKPRGWVIPVVLAGVFGALGSFVGIYLAWAIDLPAGATIVLVLTACFLLVWALSPLLPAFRTAKETSSCAA
ncbi:choice-of-anchor M domain-containing protein [Corynebacterium sp. SA-MJD20WY100]|uniref:choice-of-anchor M domain-containing protein n=1 Tax=Corynebacterium sp. SA-MJD20WY100 TaxID=3142969 RepID=UPI0032219531